MIHSEEFLEQLAKEKVMGDFYPFSTNDIREVEKYIRSIIGMLKHNRRILVESDFSCYGSGFASYINVRISKQYKSDERTVLQGNKLTKQTKGILLYISKLTPYWYYGASEWSVSTEEGNYVGGSSGFLSPESIEDVDDLWDAEINEIKCLFDQFRYRLLTRAELEEKVDFDIPVKTVLVNKPYQVFDFFFHWED